MELRWPFVAMVALGAMVVSGCSGDAEGSSTTPTSAPTTAATTASPSARSTAPTGQDRTRHGIAVPGARFALHKAVGIRFHSSGRSGVLVLKIRKITRGRSADLKPLGLGRRVRGMDPYYIRFAAKNLSRVDFSRAWIKDLVGIDRRGREVRHVLVIGTFPKCPASRAPHGFTKGKVTFACSLAVAPRGRRVVGARWRGEPYGPATDRAITWK